MQNKTHIVEDVEGKWMLVNGNIVSEDSWKNYEDARAASEHDNALQADADTLDDPDYYYNNVLIHWLA